MANELHGWTCPTCGAERSSCEAGHGQAPATSGPVKMDFPGGVTAEFQDLELVKRCAGEGHSWQLPERGDKSERWTCKRCAMAVYFQVAAA